MAYTYTQDHNMWVQRVAKELITASRFNLQMTRSTFYGNREAQSPSIDLPKPKSRPVTSKSVTKLTLESKAEDIKAASKAIATRNLLISKNKPVDSVEFPNINSRPASKMPSTSLAKLEMNPNLDVKTGESGNFKQIVRPVTRSSKANSLVQSVKAGLGQPRAALENLNEESRPLSQYSLQSNLSKEDPDALKVYINELENMLRHEKLKRIQSEEKLKHYISHTPVNGP